MTRGKPLTDRQRFQIRNKIRIGWPAKVVARDYKIHPDTARKIGRGDALSGHLCFHPAYGPHGCICGIEADHTMQEFKDWHEARGIPILPSQTA